MNGAHMVRGRGSGWLSARDVELLLGAVREASEALEDWEFETRMGCTRDELHALAERVVRLCADISQSRPTAHDEAVLTEREAFLAMVDFLWRDAQSAGDDLITLIGDTALLPDGEPTDPAAWTDWRASVEHIRRGKPPRDDFG